MIVQLIIFQIHEVLNWAFAGAIALLLLVTVLAIFFLYDRLLGLSTLSGETAAAGAARRHGGHRPRRRPSRGDCSRPGWATCARPRRACSTAFARTARTAPGAGFREACCGAAGLLVVAFLAVPSFFVIPVSFTEEGFLNWPPKGFSLQWYELVFASAEWPKAAARSPRGGGLRRIARDAGGGARRLRAGAPALLRQDRALRLPGLADHHPEHHHRGVALLPLLEARPGRHDHRARARPYPCSRSPTW